MRTYPMGVGIKENFPPAPPQYIAVPPADWGMFGTSHDAAAGLAMIQTLCKNAVLTLLHNSESADFVGKHDPAKAWPNGLGTEGLGPWGVMGTILVSGNSCMVSEFPCEILDASVVPRPFIDHYEPGDKIVLDYNVLFGGGQVEMFWRKVASPSGIHRPGIYLQDPRRQKACVSTACGIALAVL